MVRCRVDGHVKSSLYNLTEIGFEKAVVRIGIGILN